LLIYIYFIIIFKYTLLKACLKRIDLLCVFFWVLFYNNNKFINLLLLEINKFNKHKKYKRGSTIKHSNKLILSIIIDKFILGMEAN